MRRGVRGASVATATALLLGIGAGSATLVAPPEAAAVKWGKFGKRKLKPGTRGKDVRVLQRSLRRLKLRTRVDGRYGKGTKRSVLKLERRLGDRRVDGKVNRKDARRIKGLVQEQIARKRAAIGSSGYVFPVADPHDFGGAQSRFGAPRSGHSHQGQDVFSPCGTRMFAAQPGNVKVSSYQGSAGNYVVIDGLDGTDTVYMHMKKRSWASVGTLLYAGQQIGKVGASGNASGCHLHFEHWASPGWYSGGYPLDPLSELLYWDSYS